ncbi:MAG: phosphohydrolase [Ignavibacteria bacterium]
MTLARAIEIAFEAHKEQKDKSGEPYILHLTKVMNKGINLKEKIAGILHDLVEDTKWTFKDLEREGLDSEIIYALRCLTKKNDETYDEFIDRVKTNQLATRVKLNDLEDNLDVKRISLLTSKDTERINKYLKSYRLLSNIF